MPPFHRRNQRWPGQNGVNGPDLFGDEWWMVHSTPPRIAALKKGRWPSFLWKNAPFKVRFFEVSAMGRRASHVEPFSKDRKDPHKCPRKPWAFWPVFFGQHSHPSMNPETWWNSWVEMSTVQIRSANCDLMLPKTKSFLSHYHAERDAWRTDHPITWSLKLLQRIGCFNWIIPKMIPFGRVCACTKKKYIYI